MPYYPWLRLLARVRLDQHRRRHTARPTQNPRDGSRHSANTSTSCFSCSRPPTSCAKALTRSTTSKALPFLVTEAAASCPTTRVTSSGGATLPNSVRP